MMLDKVATLNDFLESHFEELAGFLDTNQYSDLTDFLASDQYRDLTKDMSKVSYNDLTAFLRDGPYKALSDFLASSQYVELKGSRKDAAVRINDLLKDLRGRVHEDGNHCGNGC
jgi:hypothetical protein